MYKQRKSLLKLGSSKQHGKLILRGMANDLVKNETLKTTKPRAKALQRFMDKLINIAKNNKQAHRKIYSKLQNKKSTQKILNELVERMSDRPSGFTGIYKIGFRKGDGANVYRINFIDYEPEVKTRIKKTKKKEEDKDKDKEEKKDNTGGGLLSRFRGGNDDSKKSQVDSEEPKNVRSRSGI
jgi:large subunit ribosomal protein L17